MEHLKCHVLQPVSPAPGAAGLQSSSKGLTSDEHAGGNTHLGGENTLGHCRAPFPGLGRVRSMFCSCYSAWWAVNRSHVVWCKPACVFARGTGSGQFPDVGAEERRAVTDFALSAYRRLIRGATSSQAGGFGGRFLRYLLVCRPFPRGLASLFLLLPSQGTTCPLWLL